MNVPAEMTGFVVGLQQRLRNLNLVQQFVLAGSIVVIIAMTVIGRWVASQIETGILHSTSAATVLYMESILAPLVPGLVSGTTPTKVMDARIKELFRGYPSLPMNSLSFTVAAISPMNRDRFTATAMPAIASSEESLKR